MNHYPFVSYGWICPKCGASNSPSTPQCWCTLATTKTTGGAEQNGTPTFTKQGVYRGNANENEDQEIVSEANPKK